MTWTPDVCLHHHPCQDGFAAAWAVWKRWPNCEFIGVNYGYDSPLDKCKDKHVLIVDFSYPKGLLLAFGYVANSIIVLDHHKTAAADLAGFQIGKDFEDRTEFLVDDVEDVLAARAAMETAPAILADFDMDRSGARMAWEFCHPGEPAPDLIRFIEDRDLWRFNFADSRPLYFLLLTVPMEFTAWDAVITAFEGQRDMMMLRALAIERYHDQRVADAAKYAGRIDLAGFNVPIANAPPFMASDLGNLLAEGEPFAVIWWEHWKDGESRVTYSLRSKPDGEDVSEIAKQFGGGGHARAAGFKRSETL